MKIDSKSFVPIHIQEALNKAGWFLTHSTFTNDAKNKKLYPDGKIGMQTWVLYSEHGRDRELRISYECDNAYKNVVLWHSDTESEDFRLRNILSVLMRRGLLKEGGS